MDEYEFPIIIAESAEELAELAGVTISTIRSSICRHKKGIYKSQYECIEVDDEDSEDY